jgi:hypothetical protein
VIRKALHARYVEELNPLLQQLKQQYSQNPQLQRQPLFTIPEIPLDISRATAPLTSAQEKELQTFYLKDRDAKYFIDMIGRKLWKSSPLSLDWTYLFLKFRYSKEISHSSPFTCFR